MTKEKNIEEIAEELGVDKKVLIRFIEYLKEIQLLKEKIREQSKELQYLELSSITFFPKIEYLGVYHPYKKGKNKQFDDFSRMILDLKENYLFAVNYFFDKIKDKFADKGIEVITVVPSHNPKNVETGIKTLAVKLAKYHNWIDATNCLIRTHKTEKLVGQTGRSNKNHLKSIAVNNLDKIEGKSVLLMDDILVTGNSVMACGAILLHAKVSKVEVFVLAKNK